MTTQTPRPTTPLDDLRAFLDASPSPWHAVASAVARLDAAGFTGVDLADAWDEIPVLGYVERGGALIAWAIPPDADTTAPVHLIGAHTDSPCLRVKPRPDTGLLGWRQLAVEVYGGILANSWLDRDLGVAGRLVLADGSVRTVAVHDPVARVPQLAIHLDREVSDKGLVLDRQQHLTPVWGTGTTTEGDFAGWLAAQLGSGVAAADITTWELCLFDVTPAAVLGSDRTLLASGRLDNQISCWAAIDALAHHAAALPDGDAPVAVAALFDHEEVGSESTTGASGPLLGTVLERLGTARGATRDDHLRSLAASVCVSADNAHAVHPNYPERHEPGHRPLVNAGPAIKVNANQRYATDALSAALFRRVCDEAGVPSQTFVSKNSMPCGSTIGPLAATRLGISTVDVGVPQLSMHSARELCGVDDPVHLATALRTFLGYQQR